MRTSVPRLAGMVAASLFVAAPAAAQQIYDNWNTSACGFTDVAGFDLSEPTRLTSVELWYHWRPNESEVGYVLLLDGRPLKRGRLMRAGCDPYQEAWCGARGNLGVEVPPGRVDIQVARPRLCQNPQSGGEGFARVFGLPR